MPRLVPDCVHASLSLCKVTPAILRVKSLWSSYTGLYPQRVRFQAKKERSTFKGFKDVYLIANIIDLLDSGSATFSEM